MVPAGTMTAALQNATFLARLRFYSLALHNVEIWASSHACPICTAGIWWLVVSLGVSPHLAAVFTPRLPPCISHALCHIYTIYRQNLFL